MSMRIFAVSCFKTEYERKVLCFPHYHNDTVKQQWRKLMAFDMELCLMIVFDEYLLLKAKDIHKIPVIISSHDFVIVSTLYTCDSCSLRLPSKAARARFSFSSALIRSMCSAYFSQKWGRKAKVLDHLDLSAFLLQEQLLRQPLALQHLDLLGLPSLLLLQQCEQHLAIDKRCLAPKDR